MNTAEPVSVTVKLHELLSAIPKNDRGLVWQLKDRYTGDERLDVHGVVAKAFKYILDNTDELIAALSHVQAPTKDENAVIERISRAMTEYDATPGKCFEMRPYFGFARAIYDALFPTAPAEEPVAWLQSHPQLGTVAEIDTLLPGDLDNGWTQRPLYASPSPQVDEAMVERGAIAMANENYAHCGATWVQLSTEERTLYRKDAQLCLEAAIGATRHD